MMLAEEVLAAHPRASIIADVKASQALFDRIATLGGQPVHVQNGAFHHQDTDGGKPARPWPAR